jgi:AcrR family transcriptional regulator
VNAIQRKSPRSEAKAESQRERILDAAQKCFIEHGFHSAGMALIAETAGISAGLIYRYFDSKNAIVLAIIARELEGKRAKIEELYSRPGFLDAVVEKFCAWQSGDASVMNAPLFLEMSAEATRAPEIARAIEASDALTREDFEQWLSRAREEGGMGIAKDVARAHAILMQCLIEGLVVRAVRDPGLDAATLRHALEPLFRHLGLGPAGRPQT